MYEVNLFEGEKNGQDAMQRTSRASRMERCQTNAVTPATTLSVSVMLVQMGHLLRWHINGFCSMVRAGLGTELTVTRFNGLPRVHQNCTIGQSGTHVYELCSPSVIRATVYCTVDIVPMHTKHSLTRLITLGMLAKSLFNFDWLTTDRHGRRALLSLPIAKQHTVVTNRSLPDVVCPLEFPRRPCDATTLNSLLPTISPIVLPRSVYHPRFSLFSCLAESTLKTFTRLRFALSFHLFPPPPRANGPSSVVFRAHTRPNSLCRHG